MTPRWQALLCQNVDGNVNVESGHFNVTLDDCDAADFTAGTAWVEVRVGATTTLPRSKVGAVPFAIEAENASFARAAFAGSQLETDLQNLAVYRNGNAVYGRSGVYCGTSGGMTGNVNGNWTGVKGIDPVGMTNINGWYLGGWGQSTNNDVNQSCLGWSSADGNRMGHFWDNGAPPHPSATTCNTMRGFLCCL